MSTLKERMKTALEHRTARARPGEKVSPAELARASKATPASVSDWFSGKSGDMKARTALLAAKYLEVDPTWLVTGDGCMEPYKSTGSVSEPPTPVNATGSNITHELVKLGHTGPQQYGGRWPVVANLRVGADGSLLEEKLHPSEAGWVRATGPGEAYAMRVKGDGLSPAYKDGLILLVRPGATIKSGKNIVLAMTDGRKEILEFLYPQDDAVVVMPIKGGLPQTVQRSDIESMHLIFGTLDADEWRPSVVGEEETEPAPITYAGPSLATNSPERSDRQERGRQRSQHTVILGPGLKNQNVDKDKKKGGGQ